MADSNDDNNKDQGDATEDFIETITKVLSHTVNEPILMKRIEKYLSPPPANIFNSDDEREDITHHVHEFLEKLAGPREVEEDTPPERVRTYPVAISNELTNSFFICRLAVCRLHMHYIGLECARIPAAWLNLTEEDSRTYPHTLELVFWDALEIATIRLASYWDRVGQLLDFVFFNIRQYERDGFPVVLERIKKNFAPTFPEVVGDPNWDTLLEYANSEKPSGFKWLARRRNLAVHSTHFRPHEDKRDALFEYEFNHYEARVIRDLALKSPKEELEVIHLHLTKAAQLFRGVFDFARLGVDLIEQDVISRGL